MTIRVTTEVSPSTEFPVSSELRPLDTEALLRALAAHGVEHILIGGVAALVHGATRVTVDADVVPEPSQENLNRLLAALRSIDAAVFVPAERLRMEASQPWEAEALGRGPAGLLEAEAWHFTTSHGPLDVVMRGAGVGGHAEHAGRSVPMSLFGLQVLVAGIDDLIAAKQSLGREKDLSVLAELIELRDR